MNNNSHYIKGFCKQFSEHIYPIYKAKEETFDADGIHGVLHIGRSIVAAYTLACKCKELGYVANIEDVIIATAFHDSGRQNNGDDYWEGKSSENCANFINKMEQGYGEPITVQSTPFVASHIVKSNKKIDSITENVSPFSMDFMIVYDSDCLEIMRPCTGRGGINGFIKEKMCLYNFNFAFRRFYNDFIKEWWEFISETEANKKKLSDENCLSHLINLIEGYDDNKYPILKKYLTN